MNETIPTPSSFIAGLLGPARSKILFLPHSPEATRRLLTAIVQWAAGGGAARVVDGANAFDGYFVARAAYRWSADPGAALRRISLSRAFTCFQLAQRVETLPALAARPGGRRPSVTVVLGLLDTFYDESVPLVEARRLLDGTLARLNALARDAPVVVSSGEPRALVKDRWSLLERLQLTVEAIEPTVLHVLPSAPVQLPLPGSPVPLPAPAWVESGGRGME